MAMLTATFTAFLCYILHLNVAKQLNADVTLQIKHMSLFTEGEIWGRKLINKTSDIIQLNVVIDESKATKILKHNKDMIMKFDVIYPDVDIVIQKERSRINKTARWTHSDLPDFFFLEYRSWPEYVVFLNAFLLRFPQIASQSYLGTTIQGRDIPIITLSTSGDTKPGLYIQAVVHAREWLANAATMYIMNALAEGYGTDESITNIMDAINIYIVPTVNIDGYIYSYEVDRNWRKNRRNNGDGTFGVDINRNYNGPVGTWCTTGASSNPSSNTYCGPSPYSEPETQAAVSFVSDDSYNIKAAIDMHTSGPLILWPWGYTADTLSPPYYEDYFMLGTNMQNACFEVNGVTYTSQPAADLSVAAGAFEDWAWSILNIYGFTFEGRGPGFNPSPGNIIPGGQEQLAAILELAREKVLPS